MEKFTRKERILYALKQIGVEKITDFGEPHGSAQYSQIYRQLYTDKYNPTIELVEYICNKYPQISSEYLVTGAGWWERTKVVTPPTNRQDIHIEGSARAAISQSGSATIEPDEPIGQESLIDLLNEKDARIAQLEKDLDTLKDAIRVLSAK